MDGCLIQLILLLIYGATSGSGWKSACVKAAVGGITGLLEDGWMLHRIDLIPYLITEYVC